MPSDAPRLLIVEDDADCREMLSYLLTREAYEVITATGVGDGLTVALQRHLDLIMIDNWLAEGSGVMLCRSLRAFDNHTPILFCSAAAYQTDIQAALDAGAQKYITKPADPDNLLQTVRELIRQGSRDKVNQKYNS
jgi:two-component system OmpR family response regulator